MMLVVVLLVPLLGLTSAFLPPFMLLTPPSFRAGHSTTLHILLFKEYKGSVTMNFLNIVRTRDTTNSTLLKTMTIDFQPNEKVIKLPIHIPAIFEGDFKLTFNGSVDDGHFGREQTLALHPVTIYNQMIDRTGGYKTYVQTDKPVYKPGQPVRFRGFAVDSDLQGVELEGMRVVIQSPNKITLFDETVSPNGTDSVLHEGVFLLADEAEVGAYTITVTGKGPATCAFSVEEYVTPKFGVEISGPSYISSGDSVIRGRVSATYTYGEPVTGILTLNFAIDNSLQNLHVGAYEFRTLTMNVTEGTADWEVDVSEMTAGRLKYLFNPFCTPSARLLIVANITDNARGFEVVKTSSDTKFAQSSFKLTFNKNTQKNYVTGFPYYVELDVEDLTNSPVDNVAVKLTMISGLSDLKYAKKQVLVKDGKAFARFDVPEDACALKITAEMDISSACDSVFACFQPDRMVSKGDEHVRFVKSAPQSYTPGVSAQYTVSSNKAVEILHFIVLSKGNIVRSWNENPAWVKDESDKHQMTGSFVVPEEINVRSRLIVLSANAKTGFIMGDAIDLSIKEFLKHSLEIQFDKVSAKPGERVKLVIKSDPKSIVGLSVNDASLNLIKKPCKTLTKESTLSFLEGLDTGTNKDRTCQKEDPYQCKPSTEIKITYIKSLLMGEGLFVVSNMNMFSYATKQPVPQHGEKVFYKAGAGGGHNMALGRSALYEYNAETQSTEVQEAVQPRLRNVFPETWIWTDVKADKGGRQILSVIAPDTITGWVGNAFGLSPENGLGFSNEVKFKTFLPFFISLDLPYSGTVGERITVPIRVFNYLDTEITTDIKITSKMWETKKASVTVPANKAATIDYTVSLTEAGNHAIKVEAYSTKGESDAIEKSLFVKPGGEKIVESTNLLIMERNKAKSRSQGGIKVALPKNYIPGSHSLKVVAVGDILGEAVSGISNLIQLPSGCGEQNMHKIAINVFSANYLMNLYNNLPENIEYNIKHNLNVGLQQQFGYRKGSSYSSKGYSVFKGGETSDWLSAFVYKITSQFPKEVFLPCGTISQDRNYLINLTPYNRSYTATPARSGWAPAQYTHHKRSSIYWAAYYVVALLESEGVNRCGANLTKYSYVAEKVAKACNATAFAYKNAGDCCYHHMVAYSLNLCEKHGLLDSNDYKKPYDDGTCLGRSKNKRFMFASCQDDLKYESVKGSSKSIEATGYAALYLMSKDKLRESLPLIMWLAGQRNENGGFRSSQDTVIGLQALSKFAELSNADMSDKTSLSIYIGKAKLNSWIERFTINNKNKLSVQESVLDPDPVTYKVKWSGVGVAFVQLISSYHVTDNKYDPIFELGVSPAAREGVTWVDVSFTTPTSTLNNMFLLEVHAPSGLVFSKGPLEDQMQNTEGGFDIVDRYDIKEMGEKLQLYLNLQAGRKYELAVPVERRFRVENSAPTQVSLLDYYEPSVRETVFYTIGEEMV